MIVSTRLGQEGKRASKTHERSQSSLQQTMIRVRVLELDYMLAPPVRLQADAAATSFLMNRLLHGVIFALYLHC
jgi:hypothetical protein